LADALQRENPAAGMLTRPGEPISRPKEREARGHISFLEEIGKIVRNSAWSKSFPPGAAAMLALHE